MSRLEVGGAVVLAVAATVFSAPARADPRGVAAIGGGTTEAPGQHLAAQPDPLASGEQTPPELLRPTREVVRASVFPRRAHVDPDVRLADEDLAPFFREEPYSTAKSRFDAGRYAEAAALLDGKAVTAPARFLWGLALLRARQSEKAGVVFQRLGDDYQDVSDRCHFHAAAAFEDRGDLSRSADEYARVDEGSILYKESRRSLARVQRARGDHKGAIAALEPLSRRPAPPYGWDSAGDALFAIAEARQALSDINGAAGSFLATWSEHPMSRFGEAGLARARALKAEPTVEQTIVRGELLMESHRNRQAIALLTPIHDAPPKGLSAAWLCRARFALGKANRKERIHGKAIDVLEQVAGKCEDPEIRAKALYVAGTSASLVVPEKAIGFYRQLAEELPEHSFADDARFFAGEQLARIGRTAEARSLLLRMAKLYRDGDFRAEGLFKVFWIDRSLGQLDRGLKVLDRLERDYAAAPDPQDQERASYWRARTLVDLGRREEGLASFESLAREHPSTYYGLLARSRLLELSPDRGKALVGALAKPVAAKSGFSLPAGRALEDRHFRAALELLRMGLGSYAIDELLNVERGVHRDESEPNTLRLVVLLLNHLGEMRVAHVIARQSLNRDLSGRHREDTLAVWKAAYPLAFRETVLSQCGAAGAEPDLIQGLMREESALDPFIHSWAGAVGLCQLMLPTANEVAGWLGIKGRITAQRLYDPGLNILFGATYLARLLKRFDGNAALALASYNAGAGAVSGWLGSTPSRTLDEFVEEIPIAETRNYVKRVLRSYNTYRLLYGDGAAPVIGQGLAPVADSSHAKALP